MYELSDHLGNVNVTVSDVKFEENGLFTAQVVSASEVYPFGMEKPLRSYKSDSYRYGFNGKEKDDAIKGSGNHVDFGARGYDSRIGKWMSVDPLALDQPAWSPYHFAANNPIWNIDIDGLIPYPITVRSFAPFESFGGGFHGDDRGFTTSSSASARDSNPKRNSKKGLRYIEVLRKIGGV